MKSLISGFSLTIGITNSGTNPGYGDYSELAQHTNVINCGLARCGEYS